MKQFVYEYTKKNSGCTNKWTGKINKNGPLPSPHAPHTPVSGIS